MTKVKAAKTLKRTTRHAYVARWKVKKASAKGMYPGTEEPSGELLVAGLETPRESRLWMERIGKKSIGLGINGLPGTDPGSAMLRVGEKLYTYNLIQGDSVRHYDWDEYLNPFTEITIPATNAEIKAIQAFIKARQQGRIKAANDIRNGPREGEAIRPNFDFDDATLTKESCAGACSSPFNPEWLEHYQDRVHAPVLRRFMNRVHVKTTAIAKQFIWGNVRNDMVLGITLHKIRGHEGRGDLVTKDFLKYNYWGRIRGSFGAYKAIPDPDRASNSFTSVRYTLEEWLDEVTPEDE